MKNIKYYPAKKYRLSEYEEVSSSIYKHANDYVTSLSFEQEPSLGEGTSATDISQYPLEDLLDQYGVWVSDFYPDLNTPKSKICYLEFAASNRKNIENLLSVIGKRVYNKSIYENGEEYAVLTIE